MAELTSLEHSTLKVPYEILNKKFRAAQKIIDREVSHVQTASLGLENCLKLQPISNTVVVSALDSVIQNLSVLKRKAGESLQDELGCARMCKRRIDHLSQSEMDGSVGTLWKKKRLDRMLVEYFLRKGYYETALKLARHSDIEDLTNINLFLMAKQVEDALGQHDTGPCLLWCYDNKSKLRKMHSTLEFNIRQQEFIELIRDNKRLDAVRHAKKYMSGMDADHQTGLQTMMGLLVYPCDTQIPPYKKLLDPDRWSQLIEQFRLANFQLHQLHSMSVFTATLQVGLSALKTHQCYKSDTVPQSTHCPVCSPPLNNLARFLPYSHSANSKLVCYISGDPLNEDNPPLMLPNGYVYSTMSVAAGASFGNYFVCPRTKQEFSISDAEKIYIM